MSLATDKYQILKNSFTTDFRECEVCSSSDAVVFQKRGRVGTPGEYGTLNITICTHCGYKMQNPRYPDEFYEAYYQELYREVAFGDLTPDEAYIEEQRSRGKGVRTWFSKHVAASGTMLDHGCASGCTMHDWAEAGWTCVGLDPHKPSVEAGRRLGFDIRVGAGEALPLDDSSFDVVVSLGSFEHSYNLALSLQEIRRVLKKNGHLLIRWRSAEIFGSPLEYYNHNHYRFFTPKTLALTLETNGFKIIAETDEKLEGWDSYAYTLAIRSPHQQKSQSQIEVGDGDDYKEELAKIDRLRKTFYEKSKLHLANASRFLANAPRNYSIDDLRTIFGDSHNGFLGGNPETVLRRTIMEAEKYIEEYDAGLVN